MSDPTPNPDPKEATEAKLCAYLEGELTAADKVEIEQHLAANPQHRQLLVELAKTREWMRSIPREKSPVDLGELFQTQVERAMLLDETADAGSGMSINRWPQYVLVAAVTVLALGLSAVLVAILKNPSNTAMSGAGLSKGSPLATTSQPSEAFARKSMENQPVAPLPPVDAGAPPVVAMAPPATGMEPLNMRSTGGSRSRETATEAETIKTQLKTAGIKLSPDQKTVCFVVSADAPAVTAEQVQGFFDRHQILVDNLSALNGSNRGVAAGGGVNYGNGGGRQQLAGADNNNFSRAAQNAGNLNGQNNFVQNGGQSVAQNQQVQAPNAADEANNAKSPNNFAGTTLDAVPATVPNSPIAGDAFFVAHGVTPLQMELLNASLLGRADLKQTVQRVTLSTPDAAKMTALPAGAISKGQSLTVTIPQLVGPGIEKTNVVTVSDDGTITLPMIDPVPAAGSTPAELQKRVAEKYRDGNLISDADVSIAAATGSPPGMATTQPAKDKAQASTHPVVTTTPATRAVDPSLVDVVVVIQPSRFAAMPATTLPVK